MVFLQPLLLLMVQNPNIPFLTTVPSDLKSGMMVRVKGFMPAHDRFVVEFLNGPLFEYDKPLHMSIRPDENAIIRNFFENNQYGDETRNGGCPIKYNSTFEILISVQEDKFKIAIDGQHFADYNHKLPLAKAKIFQIRGNVKIATVTFEEDFIVESSRPIETSLTNCAAPYSPYPIPNELLQPISRESFASLGWSKNTTEPK